jgi:hypothetical protein
VRGKGGSHAANSQEQRLGPGFGRQFHSS